MAWRAVRKKNGKLGPKEWTDQIHLPEAEDETRAYCCATFGETMHPLKVTVFEMKNRVATEASVASATKEVWRGKADGFSFVVKILPQAKRQPLAVLENVFTKKIVVSRSASKDLTEEAAAAFCVQIAEKIMKK